MAGPASTRSSSVLEGSLAREHDRRAFFQAQVLFWMLCATDGHAKNFSLFIRPGGATSSTPLYDVLSAYPVLGEGVEDLAAQGQEWPWRCDKNAHWKMKDILRRHWDGTGPIVAVAAPRKRTLRKIELTGLRGYLRRPS
jgi:serine/threonine-protein kinase HipA